MEILKNKDLIIAIIGICLLAVFIFTDEPAQVVADGTYATISLHTQDAQGIWVEHFSATGRVGKNGIGKTAEGDGKTPTGKYSFMKAFGILPDPGITALPYLQVDESYQWIDDSNSKYYNQFVSTNDVEVDWVSSEALYATGQAYHYALAINYNEACIPGLGSAIIAGKLCDYH